MLFWFWYTQITAELNMIINNNSNWTCFACHGLVLAGSDDNPRHLCICWLLFTTSQLVLITRASSWMPAVFSKGNWHAIISLISDILMAPDLWKMSSVNVGQFKCLAVCCQGLCCLPNGILRSHLSLRKTYLSAMLFWLDNCLMILGY